MDHRADAVTGGPGMSEVAATLLQQALTLPEDDRRWIAEQLDASLGPAESRLPDDPDTVPN